MCCSSSTWLLLTDDKERHLCRALQRANRIQETPTPRARGMPPTDPVWCTHACDNTQRYSMRCTYRRCLHNHIRGAQEKPHTQYKHRTRWSRSTRTTTPRGNPQRRARHLQQPKGRHNARPARKVPAAPEAGSTHRAHHPHVPPTRYTANTRSQRPMTTRTMTPALPAPPGPWGGRR